MFKIGTGNWTQYRGDGVMEVDFHWAEKGSQWEPKPPYHERMAGVYSTTLRALENAYQNGVERIIFIHGWSTSRPGKETSRSVVRGVMRSKHATPYICRRECIQHETVCVAAIRPREGWCVRQAWLSPTRTTLSAAPSRIEICCRSEICAGAGQSRHLDRERCRVRWCRALARRSRPADDRRGHRCRDRRA